MRILVLAKRQYTGKDLLTDRYGRVFEIPAALSRRGHEVRGLATSYRHREQGDLGWESLPRMSWRSVNAVPFGIARYASLLDAWVDGWSPDVVWAGSDMLHAVLAARWARTRGVPLILDLYDNYESFGLSKLPGLTNAFQRACRQAEAVTVVSHTLANYIKSNYALKSPIAVLQNGISKDLFRPRDRQTSRAALGLPSTARIIGTAGAISSDRGIELMFQAFLELAETDADLWLLHAGPVDRRITRRFGHPRIVNLGMLPLESVPQVISALDVAIVCNRDSNFGRYCFPMKLYEILAMRVPLIAAAVGDVASILSGYPGLLFPPDDLEGLKTCITTQLLRAMVPELPAIDWENCADVLEHTLLEVTQAR